MNRRKLFIALVVILLGVNCLLIVLDDEGEVARVSYVQDWAAVAEKDMAETIETKGVLAADKKPVYFDKKGEVFRNSWWNKGLLSVLVTRSIRTKWIIMRKQRQIWSKNSAN